MSTKEISAMPGKGTRPRMQGFFQDYYEELIPQGYGWKEILWMFQPMQLQALNMLAPTMA